MFTFEAIVRSIVERCVLIFRALLDPVSSGHRALMHDHRMERIRSTAIREGYTVLRVEGKGPVDMLLLRRQERVVVLSEGCRGWSRSQVDFVRRVADADVAWLPSDFDEQPTPQLRRIRLSTTDSLMSA